MLTLRESVNAPLFLCPDLWVTWPSCPCPVPCPGIADIWWVPVLCPAVVPPAPVVVVYPVCTPAGVLSICLAAVLCCLACCLSDSAWVFLSSFFSVASSFCNGSRSVILSTFSYTPNCLRASPFVELFF